MISRRLSLPALTVALTAGVALPLAAQVTSVRSGSEKFDRDSTSRTGDALASAEALANDRCAPRCAARAARESSERRQSGTYCSGRRIRRGWIMRASNVINSGRRLVRRPSSERLLDAGRWMATSPFAVGRSASAALAAVGRNVRGVGVGAASTRHPRPRLLRPYNADSMSPTRSTKRRRRPLR